jgi:dephospho-CoA kinase
MPQVVGLTGGIATGKSTVSRLWRKARVFVIDADDVARDVVRPGRAALRLIRWRFGRDVLGPDGTLDRAALGRIIFSDPVQRRRLNLIMHPFIIASILRRLLFALVVRFEPVVVLDTPLLYESGALLPLCSATVVVACSPEQQLERLLRRSRAQGSSEGAPVLSEREARERIAAQMPLEDKVARAHHVLDNSQSERATEEAAAALLADLRPSPAGELAFRALVIGVASKVVASVFWRQRGGG